MCKTGWWKKMFWAGLGAIISQLSAPHIEQITRAGYDRWCGGAMSLMRGKETLRIAIEKGQLELLPSAKAALEKSISCHVPEASFLLGVMYCNGLGVKKDRAFGMQLVRTAAGSEPQWAMQLLGNPELCPRANNVEARQAK